MINHEMPVHNLISLMLALLSIAAFPAKTAAESQAAAWLKSEQIREGCSGSTGRFSADGAREIDLTGDGKADLILDHSELTCDNNDFGGRSGFCGIRACSVIFYIRKGDLLKQELDVLSIGHDLGPGNPPEIKLLSHSFEEHVLRWNGKAFK